MDSQIDVVWVATYPLTALGMIQSMEAKIEMLERQNKKLAEKLFDYMVEDNRKGVSNG